MKPFLLGIILATLISSAFAMFPSMKNNRSLECERQVNEYESLLLQAEQDGSQCNVRLSWCSKLVAESTLMIEELTRKLEEKPQK